MFGTREEVRDIVSPLTAEQLAPAGPGLRSVQFRCVLGDHELRALAAFMRASPELNLRVYGYEIPDLDFLRYFPFLRSFTADSWALRNFEGLRHLSPELHELHLGQTKAAAISLRMLELFPQVRFLSIEGHAKDFSSIGALSKLRRLVLRSVTFPDLAPLTALPDLGALAIKLGGTRNLAHLRQLTRLRYLELWMIRGLADVSVIAEIPALQDFLLQSLRQVTTLPSLRGMRDLRKVSIETMKGLQDLGPIAEAPGLEEFSAVAMCHLKPEAFRPFVGHPTLRSTHAGLCSDKKNAAVKRMLGPRQQGDPTGNTWFSRSTLAQA